MHRLRVNRPSRLLLILLFWFSVTRWLRRVVVTRGRISAAHDRPGLLLLEIDGLAEPVLRQALAQGYMPTLGRWLERRSHRVTPWECDLSSQTSASQAGILHGNNSDIPAYRWIDKATGRLFVSKRFGDISEVESRISDGNGLLARDGASRGNMLSGDAPDSLFTFSTARRPNASPSRYYLLLFLNPYNVARTVARFAADVATELYEARRQRLLDERPRVERGGAYPLKRAFLTCVLRELNTFALALDIRRGVPIAYATYFAYDEVAHHSGIARRDALRTLRVLDRDIGRLERVAQVAPRPYRFVVLSDHGQSQGATFKQRYEKTLGELVAELIGPGSQVTELAGDDEQSGALAALLSEVARVPGVLDDAAAAPPARPKLHRSHAVERIEDVADGTAVYVLASGNSAPIYCLASPERMSLEQLQARFPSLIPGLARHPGVGFLLVRSAQHGPLAIGARGVHFLPDGRVDGDDPLAAFGPRAARHLLKEDSFSNAPDILVNSLYDPEADEVAAFEELVGSHGGLGGLQARPFVLHPVDLDPGDEPIVGPCELHRVLCRWRDELRAGGHV